MKRNNNLSAEQVAVLFDKATESPYSGSLLYVDDKGVYSCANCHSELFDSDSKYDARCGWPSFDETLSGAVDYQTDTTHGMTRTEVNCGNCGGHLGHVFDDGPADTTGKRYCINSLSLVFEPEKKAKT